MSNVKKIGLIILVTIIAIPLITLFKPKSSPQKLENVSQNTSTEQTSTAVITKPQMSKEKETTKGYEIGQFWGDYVIGYYYTDKFGETFAVINNKVNYIKGNKKQVVSDKVVSLSGITSKYLLRTHHDGSSKEIIEEKVLLCFQSGKNIILIKQKSKKEADIFSFDILSLKRNKIFTIKATKRNSSFNLVRGKDEDYISCLIDSDIKNIAFKNGEMLGYSSTDYVNAIEPYSIINIDGTTLIMEYEVVYDTPGYERNYYFKNGIKYLYYEGASNPGITKRYFYPKENVLMYQAGHYPAETYLDTKTGAKYTYENSVFYKGYVYTVNVNTKGKNINITKFKIKNKNKNRKSVVSVKDAHYISGKIEYPRSRVINHYIINDYFVFNLKTNKFVENVNE